MNEDVGTHRPREPQWGWQHCQHPWWAGQCRCERARWWSARWRLRYDLRRAAGRSGRWDCLQWCGQFCAESLKIQLWNLYISKVNIKVDSAVFWFKEICLFWIFDAKTEKKYLEKRDMPLLACNGLFCTSLNWVIPLNTQQITAIPVTLWCSVLKSKC